MKKLLTLIFVTIFLFTSCKEEVKPKEVETPIDVEKNTEVKHSEKIETPTEVEEIILPEPDENTKVIEISFPEDFYEYEYTEPELVSPEEFEWGEYVPFVRFNDFYYNSIKSSEEKNYAIFSDVSYTLESGAELYSKINEKFVVEYEGEKFKTNFSGIEDNGKYDDFLYKSRVVYISPELDFVGRVRLYPNENSWTRCNSQYDIVSEKGILESFYDENLETGEMTLGGNTRNRGWYDYCDPIYEYNNKLFGFIHSLDGKHWPQYSNGHYLSLPVFYYWEEYQLDDITTATKTYQFYSVEDNSIKYKLIFTDKFISQKAEDSAFPFETSYYTEFYPCNNLRQLVCFSKFTYQGGGLSLSYDCYMLDLESKELTYLESYAFEPSISPDGKYLLYVNHNEGEYPVDMGKGIYIKNLENNTTVYYETSGFYNTHGIIEWINKDKLIDLIQ